MISAAIRAPALVDPTSLPAYTPSAHAHAPTAWAWRRVMRPPSRSWTLAGGARNQQSGGLQRIVADQPLDTRALEEVTGRRGSGARRAHAVALLPQGTYNARAKRGSRSSAFRAGNFPSSWVVSSLPSVVSNASTMVERIPSRRRLGTRRKPLAEGLIAWAKQRLLLPAYFFNTSFFFVARMAMACARGALNATTRRLDPTRTLSWEFSAFSQNGEDGIIDHLLSLVKAPTRYFVEIGASDGLENNSSYLAFVKKYRGLMVEGNPTKSANSRRFLQHMNWGVTHITMLVTPEKMLDLRNQALYPDPDLFTLDIDGVDFYIARAALDAGFRPKILCVEYNSTFGPERALTVTYRPDFDYTVAHPSLLYYGASLAAWKCFFASRGYHFVTVDSAGVNAFFVDPAAVDMTTLGGLDNIDFEENAAHRVRCGLPWQEQFALIRKMDYYVVAPSSAGQASSALSD